jgi:integration host factor subunit beta
MTRSELVDALVRRRRIARALAEAIVDQFFDGITGALRSGSRVEVRGFGTFTARRYKGYEGRNPRTGALIVVRPKVLPFFRVGKELKERIEEQGKWSGKPR